MERESGRSRMTLNASLKTNVIIHENIKQTKKQDCTEKKMEKKTPTAG